MASSKMLAERCVIGLSGLALGMWEAARLLSAGPTRDAGRRKVTRLRDKLESFRDHADLNDSLGVILKRDINLEGYDYVLVRLEEEDFKNALPEIEKLVQATSGYLNDFRRATSGFERTL